jgi:hypothetical protein
MRCSVLAAVAIAWAAQAASHDAVVATVEKEYRQKQNEYNQLARCDRYRWEFIRCSEYPYWCKDNTAHQPKGEAMWVAGYGDILTKSEQGIYIGVRSWIDRKENRSQVSRLYLFKHDNKRGWYRAAACKVVEDWSDQNGWVCQRDDKKQ